jgi:hypothetical protein
MNLKAKRLVRTIGSEQYALFDLDRTDENFDPMSVGKIDVHYTEQGIYGTLLFWAESCARYSWAELTRLAEALLAEFNSPMGVPAEYAVEFFTPSLSRYELLTNIASDDLASVEDVDRAGEQASAQQMESTEAGPIDEAEEKVSRDVPTENDAAEFSFERLDLHRRVDWRDED